MTVPVQPNEFYVTHLNYEGVPAEFTIKNTVTKRSPKAVSAVFVVDETRVVTALAITGRSDTFSRKRGRELATDRLNAYLEGAATDDDMRFIRISPALRGEALDLHIRRTLSQFGFATETEEGKQLAKLMHDATPLCQTISYITNFVREAVSHEFGPTLDQILAEY